MLFLEIYISHNFTHFSFILAIDHRHSVKYSKTLLRHFLKFQENLTSYGGNVLYGKKIVSLSNFLLLRRENFLMWGCIERATYNVNKMGEFGAFLS
jgi:hypothetical protein